MRQKNNILVFRFSAMGDVALTVPVLAELIKNNPDVKVTMVSKGTFQPFFRALPNICFFNLENKKKHAGLIGLVRLGRELRRLRPDLIIDLHQNLRSNLLKVILFTIPAFSLNKLRKEKKEIILKRKFRQIPHVTEQYLAVFHKAGFKVPAQLEKNERSFFLDINTYVNDSLIQYPRTIGIAPFAQHKTKIWPDAYYIELIEKIHESFPLHQLLFFGGGETEKQKINDWIFDKPYCNNLISKLKLEEELHLLSKLEVLIAADSSNMHLGILSGISVISIWGATHPMTGFGPLFNEHLAIETPLPTLSCRPCSVYGKKPCIRGDQACLNIPPSDVMEKLKQAIRNKSTF